VIVGLGDMYSIHISLSGIIFIIIMTKLLIGYSIIRVVLVPQDKFV